jgi:hypothetical protein
MPKQFDRPHHRTGLTRRRLLGLRRPELGDGGNRVRRHLSNLGGVPYEVFNGFLPENPHIRFFESRERGYVLVDVSPEVWRTDLRVVDTITQPEATARTLGS